MTSTQTLKDATMTSTRVNGCDNDWYSRWNGHYIDQHIMDVTMTGPKDVDGPNNEQHSRRIRMLQ